MDLACTGLADNQLALAEPNDHIILDVMLSDVDGWRIVNTGCKLTHRGADEKLSCFGVHVSERKSHEGRVLGRSC